MLSLRRIPRPMLPELRREMDRLFDGLLGNDVFDLFGAGQAYPPVNLWEEHDRMLVEAEVPGFTMEDLELLVQGNELTIKGRRQIAADENAVFHRRERMSGEFVRHMRLPTDVDADHVEATLKDGVLTVVLPKSEQARARKIAVKVN